MRWQGREESENVEDRRGMGPRVMVGGGLGMLALVVIYALLGGDPQQFINAINQGQPQGGGAAQGQVDPAQEEVAKFVRVVLRDTEKVWGQLFREQGRMYRDPTLVMFSGQVDSACGMASAAVGPFYCPMDEKVYLDLDFFQELKDRFHAPGEFAQAYVIAHEIGHHVQKQLGISDKVHALQQRVGRAEANQLSVRLELQADFLAGVWAHHADEQFHILERGDVEAAMNAAKEIGDDNLQREGQGYVVPESFTHGTSAQRARWFRKGLETGDMNQGDTFDTDDL